MKKVFLLFVGAMSSLTVCAQNITDVVRWSVNDLYGTARTLGAGSSFGAMGGDFSVLSINPAGIADYRISEFTITPSLKSASTSAYFNGDAKSVEKSKSARLGLDNIGFVIASRPGENWTSSNFAFGFSRTADHGRSIFLKGKIDGSMATYFAQQANGLKPDDLDDFIAYPAYNTGAIYDLEGDNFYETDFLRPDEPVSRTQEIYQQGGVNQLELAWAGEFRNWMNLGVSIGVPFASFEELKTYKESDPADEIEIFKDLTYTERLNTSGVGINLKAGMVLKILPTLRLGAAFQSPTWYKFTDDYNTSMRYSFAVTEEESYEYDSPEGVFEYRITTPWRTTLSAGKTFRAGDFRGFINGDVELVDYSNASYNGTAYTNSESEREWTAEVNREILNRLGRAVNFRLGGEFGYRNLRLRAGYSWERPPFNADDFFNRRLSLGVGFREENFFIDFGFRTISAMEGYYPYQVLDQTLDPLTQISTKRLRSALTVGFKF